MSDAPQPGASSRSASESSGSGAVAAEGDGRPSVARQAWVSGPQPGNREREREQSVGAQSVASSSGTGSAVGGTNVARTASRRSSTRQRNRSALGTSVLSTQSGTGSGTPGPRRKRDKHSRALLSIRDFLRGRNCYDCLPVSFRLVVLDTKLVVKPAIEVMWQSGVVSAPLWQSSTGPTIPVAASSQGDESVSNAESGHGASSVEGGAASSLSSGVQHDTSLTSEQSSNAPSAAKIPLGQNSLPLHLDSPAALAARSASPGASSLQSDAAGFKLRLGSQQQRSVAPPPGQAGFAGMLTVNDIIHLIQYYYKHSSYDNAAQDVERFRLEMLRDIEHSLNVPEPPLLSIEPLRPLFEACQLLMKTHARRLPLLDRDAQTGMDTVVSVLTQYRVLKFIAMNCRETAYLNRSIRSLGIGTYVNSPRKPSTDWPRLSIASSTLLSSRRSSSAAPNLSPIMAHSESVPKENSESESGQGSSSVMSPVSAPQAEQSTETKQPGKGTGGGGIYEPLATATLDTTVFDVVHNFSELGISAVPVLDEDGYVVDMYETVDVIDLVRSGAYQSLDLTIRQALSRRPKDFPGIMSCSPDDSLATIFSLLRTRRVHRLLILEPEPPFSAESKNPFAADSGKSSTPFDTRTEELLKSGSANGAATAASAAESARQQQQRQQAQETNRVEPFGGDLRTRGRGRLVGILCLSDIMKYIIGATPDKTLNLAHSAGQMRRGSIQHTAGGPLTSTMASTASSSAQDHVDVGQAGGNRRGSSSPSSSANVSAVGEPIDAQASASEGGEGGTVSSGTASATGSSMATAAARFDPSDVPPTIQEQPTVEATASTQAAHSETNAQESSAEGDQKTSEIEAATEESTAADSQPVKEPETSADP